MSLALQSFSPLILPILVARLKDSKRRSQKISNAQRDQQCPAERNREDYRRLRRSRNRPRNQMIPTHVNSMKLATAEPQWTQSAERSRAVRVREPPWYPDCCIRTDTILVLCVFRRPTLRVAAPSSRSRWAGRACSVARGWSGEIDGVANAAWQRGREQRG